MLWSIIVVVSFVDIGGIIDHHCLSFLLFVDIGRIIDHHCLSFLCFVNIGRIIDHHCLSFLCFVDIGRIIDHHCLSFLFIVIYCICRFCFLICWWTSLGTCLVSSSSVTERTVTVPSCVMSWQYGFFTPYWGGRGGSRTYSDMEYRKT